MNTKLYLLYNETTKEYRTICTKCYNDFFQSRLEISQWHITEVADGDNRECESCGFRVK